MLMLSLHPVDAVRPTIANTRWAGSAKDYAFSSDGQSLLSPSSVASLAGG